ncbi:hypothetical protein IAL74_00790, partial [Limosilactobacillus fermentum]|nr:hypothetical protein [Limosilactobacillus fermentum]
MEDKTMIEIKDLKKSFGKNIILDGVNEEGRIVKSSATLSRRKLQMDSSSLRPYV